MPFLALVAWVLLVVALLADVAARFILVPALVVLGVASVFSMLDALRLARRLDSLRANAEHLTGSGSPSARIWNPGAVEAPFDILATRLGRTQTELDRARAALDAILAGLDVGIVLTNADGSVLRLNDAAQRMFGISEQRARARPFIQVARDHELNAMIEGTLRGVEQRAMVVEHGLDRRALHASATAITDKAETLGLVLLRDVSDVQRLESVRRDFVANVSHELRTPLTSIRALVETLESGAVDDPDLSLEFLRRIVHEVDRLAALVEDLMSLGRLEAGRATLRLEQSPSAKLLQTAGERLREQIERAGLDLTFDLPATLPDAFVDRRQIEQVVINLVHNAIKFTPAGGRVSIAARVEQDYLVAEVRDTGVGIGEDEIDRVFERFYKSDKARHSGGTGLGLAIAKHAVQMHGGDVSVTSALGEGAVFQFSVPIADTPAARALADSART